MHSKISVEKFWIGYIREIRYPLGDFVVTRFAEQSTPPGNYIEFQKGASLLSRISLFVVSIKKEKKRKNKRNEREFYESAEVRSFVGNSVRDFFFARIVRPERGERNGIHREKNRITPWPRGISLNVSRPVLVGIRMASFSNPIRIIEKYCEQIGFTSSICLFNFLLFPNWYSLINAKEN